jgi:hypothetical protein
MDRSFETKPQIIIDIHPIPEAFCRYVFGTPSHQKEIIVSRYHDIGKLIHSHVIARDLPVRKRFTENPVTFILPVNHKNQHALNHHFLDVSNWGEQKICDGIEFYFRSWVRHRFEIGYNIKNMDRKEIIEAILRGLSIRNNTTNFDMIKKIDYRNRRLIDNIKFKQLLDDCI